MTVRRRNSVTKVVSLNTKRARQVVVHDVAAKVKAVQAAKPNSGRDDY